MSLRRIRPEVARCVAPVGPQQDPLWERLCGEPATTEVLVEGLLCPLCAEHAAEMTTGEVAPEERPR